MIQRYTRQTSPGIPIYQRVVINPDTGTYFACIQYGSQRVVIGETGTASSIRTLLSKYSITATTPQDLRIKPEIFERDVEEYARATKDVADLEARLRVAKIGHRRTAKLLKKTAKLDE